MNSFVPLICAPKIPTQDEYHERNREIDLYVQYRNIVEACKFLSIEEMCTPVKCIYTSASLFLWSVDIR